MSKRFTNDFKFCYPILEHSPLKFYEKALSLGRNNNFLLELRIDYLLSNASFDDVLLVINDINEYIDNDRLIVTIRTKREGGEIELSDEKYFEYISNILMFTSIRYIDLEYDYYKKYARQYDELFKGDFNKVIISKHIFDGALETKKYEKIFDEMTVPCASIVKFAIMLRTKDELFDYMLAARECSKSINKKGKNCIFIAMGKIGSLSRLWPEFTNTKIVFLTAYSQKANKIGQLGYKDFVKYRKLLEKIDKN